MSLGDFKMENAQLGMKDHFENLSFQEIIFSRKPLSVNADSEEPGCFNVSIALSWMLLIDRYHRKKMKQFSGMCSNIAKNRPV